MINYRTQPMGYVDGEFKSVINNRQRKKDLLARVSKYITYPTDKTIDLITDASIMSAMILAGNYKNILVMTSDVFDNNEGDHLIPVIHKFNYGVGKMTVTKSKSTESKFDRLYKDFDIPSVEVGSIFALGKDSININWEGEPFDAVVLLGNEGIINKKFKSGDIKKQLAPYCEEGVDLIDIYRGSARVLLGLKTPSQSINLISSTILSNAMVELKETDKYKRVFHNIESIEQIYRVG